MNSLSKQKNILIITFLVLPVCLLVAFVIYPLMDLIKTSVTNWDGMSSTSDFVGFSNYVKMFTSSSDVWLALRNNAIYLFGHLVFIPLELMIALILENKLRGSKFFKTVTFMPYIINGVAISYTFAFFLSPINGGFNGILEALGLDFVIRNWLSDPLIVNFTLLFVSVWRYSGVHILLFIAGLQSIPEEQKEAALIDGANAFQTFRYIIVPGVRRVLEVVLFLNVRGGLQVFDIPFVMTQGGPGNASSTFSVYTLNQAFQFKDFGMASAMGVTLMILIILVNKIQNMALNIKGVDDKG